MHPQSSEWAWLDERQALSLPDLSRVCAMSVDELDELVDYGALIPLEPNLPERYFSAECVTHLRTACRLRVDFDLDLFTVAILMDYLSRIEILERDVRSLRAHLPRHIENPLARTTRQRDPPVRVRNSS